MYAGQFSPFHFIGRSSWPLFHGACDVGVDGRGTYMSSPIYPSDPSCTRQSPTGGYASSLSPTSPYTSPPTVTTTSTPSRP